jgi:hypothetical protein
MVIDMKDDFGNLHFTTDHEFARASAPCGNRSTSGTVASLRARAYTPSPRGRVQGPNLFRYDGNRHAIWNARTSALGAAPRANYWVDPHSRWCRIHHINFSRAGCRSASTRYSSTI